jgi:HEPN domain-containing protein
MRRSFPVIWLLLRALEFEKAYHAVPAMPPLSWPRYFLLCHSIELALKAYLTLHGESESDLIKIGHDLKKLLRHARKLGLTLEPDTQEAIKLLARAHNEHWARYPKEFSGTVFTIEQFEKNAAELLQQVGIAIYPPPPDQLQGFSPP